VEAVGVISADLTEDIGAKLPLLDRIAAKHGVEIVDVVTVDPGETGWVFELLERVNVLGAHAVVVESFEHVHGLERAVTGVADLHSLYLSVRYVGYGAGHTRPSAAAGGSGR